VQAVLLGHLDGLLVVMVVSCGELDDLVRRAPLGDQLGELVEEVLEACRRYADMGSPIRAKSTENKNLL
jgi:hypothetical protein